MKRILFSLLIAMLPFGDALAQAPADKAAKVTLVAEHESWTERPGDHHQVSQNASATAPAKLLAVFVVDTSDRQIVIPDK